jgi:hypothetical protein
MVAAKKKRNKQGAKHSHVKTRSKFDKADKKRDNRATILLHKEKMIKNMKFNNWETADVIRFYKNIGVTITRQTINKWKIGDRTNARLGRPCIIDDKGIAFIKKKVHEHNNTSVCCDFETFRGYCDAAAIDTATRVRPDEGILCFNIQLNYIDFMYFIHAQIVLKRDHLQM